MVCSPEGARWYLADVIVEHIVRGDPRNVVHVNTHLVAANSPDQAYEKALALGRASEQVYNNTAGSEVRTVFRGLQDLNLVHDPLEDGAELAYTEEANVSEDDLKASIRSKEKLGVFAHSGYKHDLPNYMPESIMRILEANGIDRENLK